MRQNEVNLLSAKVKSLFKDKGKRIKDKNYVYSDTETSEASRSLIYLTFSFIL